MTFEKHTIRIGDEEVEVIRCVGEGQCQCDRCKERGIYNVSWTSMFYKLDEKDEHVICKDCLYELLIQRRIERLTEERDEYLEKWQTYYMNELNLQMQVEELKDDLERLSTVQALNETLMLDIDELKEQRDVFKRLFESANTSNFSTNSIIETMNSFYREQAQHLAGLKIEQAVKDTAKEILQGFNKWLKQGISDSYEIAVLNSDGFHGGRNRAFHEVKDLVKKVAESKGVEVE